MPCESGPDCGPTRDAIELTRVAKLLVELAGKGPPDPEEWGCGPPAELHVTKRFLDRKTAELCAKLRHTAVTQYSLELQIWWRDHQRADAQREEERAKANKRDQLRQEALARLSPAHKEALGLD